MLPRYKLDTHSLLRMKWQPNVLAMAKLKMIFKTMNAMESERLKIAINQLFFYAQEMFEQVKVLVKP